MAPKPKPMRAKTSREMHGVQPRPAIQFTFPVLRAVCEEPATCRASNQSSAKECGLMEHAWLAISEWEKHQHYKNKGVPWIKLYAKMLDNAAFMAMSEVAQGQLVKLWVLASRMGNPLPNRPDFLAGKIGTKRLRIDEMLAAGFLIPASKSLDKSETESRGLSREERVEKGELETNDTEPNAEGKDNLSAPPSKPALVA